MARPAPGDLYEGIVATGAVATRAEAKVAMLGAMYGATRATAGGSCRGSPARSRRRSRSSRTRPASGRAGGVVSHPPRAHLAASASPAATSSPPRDGPATSTAACAPGVASPATSSCRAPRPSGRSAGWAPCAARLARAVRARPGRAAPRVLPARRGRRAHAGGRGGRGRRASSRSAAAEAGRLLFGSAPVRFPVTVATVQAYSDAK